jgi:sensor histidine kinase YesM
MAPYFNSYFSSSREIRPDDQDYQAKYLEIQNEMQNLFNLTTYVRSDITDLVVWSDGIPIYQLLYNEWKLIHMIDNIEEQPWYEHAFELGGRLAFTPASDFGSAEPDSFLDTSSFFITRQIRNLRNSDQNNLVIIRLSSSTLNSQLANLNLLYDSFVVITNEKNELIYSSSPLTMSNFQSVLENKPFRYHSATWDNLSMSMANYDLTVHVVYSRSELYRQIWMMIMGATGIYLLGLGIAYILFSRYNRWITSSVNSLLSTFSKIEEGDLESHCEPQQVEEFDKISNSVNAMIDRLNEKIKNEYLMAIRQKSIQLYALQSQIQPHFLNNTLYCFIALNQIGERDTLNSALYSLSHMLRYVLSKEQYTTIQQEYDFLEDYMRLQKLRFGARFSYELEAEEECRSIQIPRLLMQPLVENAIIHGIEPCENPCICRLSSRKEGNFLRISVSDDGVGFDLSILEKKKEEKKSIGIYYVKERLALWSDKAVLDIRSENAFTVIEIRVPWEETTHEFADC